MFKWEERFNKPGYWISKKDGERIHMRKLKIYSKKQYYKWKKKNNFTERVDFVPLEIKGKGE